MANDVFFVEILAMKQENKNKLECIGCNTETEALLVLPRMHIDKSKAHSRIFGELLLDRPVMLTATVVEWTGLDKDNMPTKSPYPRSIELILNFDDKKGVKTRVFGMKLEGAKEAFDKEDQKVTFEAIVREPKPGYRTINAFALCDLTGRVEPEYVGKSGQISGDAISDAIKQALNLPNALQEAAKILDANNFVSNFLREAGISAEKLIKSLHQPLTLQEGDDALRIAKASVVHEIKSAASRENEEVTPSPYNIDEKLIQLVKSQPEKLTRDQRLALNSIRLQVNERRGARILLNGDVGTGKTLVFLLALAAISQTTGLKVGVVAPSDLVARQIHQQAQKRFADLQPALVIAGSEDPPVDAMMLVGTQALFNRDVELEALVVDEQHKFSVEQRAILRKAHTHVIEASATPIPRSLALAFFDGWRHVRIKESPVQKKITSRIATTQDRGRVSDLVRRTLESGRKVIFLYTKISGPGSSVNAAGERLADRFDGRVAVLHGKMKAEEKNQQLMAFANGEKPIIVASTAIEVGVDVPDIGLMVVSDADRFGVAQLHQLRGRLARAGGEANFIMMVNGNPKKQTMMRLEALCHYSDGFSLAERDMEIRGFGEVLGDFQSGKNTETLFKLSRLEVKDFTG